VKRRVSWRKAKAQIEAVAPKGKKNLIAKVDQFTCSSTTSMYLFINPPKDDKYIEKCRGERYNKVNIIISLISLIYCAVGFPYLNSFK
jgi:hypothetical protein